MMNRVTSLGALIKREAGILKKVFAPPDVFCAEGYGFVIIIDDVDQKLFLRKLEDILAKEKII